MPVLDPIKVGGHLEGLGMTWFFVEVEQGNLDFSLLLERVPERAAKSARITL